MILRILSIAKLVLLKMRRDKRSIGLVVVAPLLIMTLITFIFNEKPGTLQRVAPAIISVFIGSQLTAMLDEIEEKVKKGKKVRKRKQVK